MILICAVDKHWNIGYGGDMLFKISEDLKRFRSITEGNIIIMGRKTFESLPSKKALSNRVNIVLTRNKDYVAENIIVIHSLDDLFLLLQRLNPDNRRTSFVIGGGEIVEQLLPYCTGAYITKVCKESSKVDSSIPNLDKKADWIIEKQTPIYNDENLKYKYVEYILKDNVYDDRKVNNE